MQVNKGSWNEITLQKNFARTKSLVPTGAMVSFKDGGHWKSECVIHTSSSMMELGRQREKAFPSYPKNKGGSF